MNPTLDQKCATELIRVLLFRRDSHETPRADPADVEGIHSAALGFPTEALDGLAAETGTPVLFAADGPQDVMADARTSSRTPSGPAAISTRTDGSH